LSSLEDMKKAHPCYLMKLWEDSLEVVVEEGELVLLNELVVGASGEDVVAPTKQVQALLIFELDAEHLDRKLGKANVAVTRLVV
jgi:hypothetical protein